MGWLRHVLAWSAGLGISFGLLGVVPASVRPAVWTEARALHLDADELRSALNLQDARWPWAILQWLVHDGPVLAAGLSIGLLVVWQVLRRARRAGGIQQYVRSAKREHLRLAGDTVARSCLVAVLTALLMYFAVTPTVVASLHVGRREQLRRERLINPESVWTELTQATAQIRTDEALMRQLAEKLADEDRRLSEQESQ